MRRKTEFIHTMERTRHTRQATRLSFSRPPSAVHMINSEIIQKTIDNYSTLNYVHIMNIIHGILSEPLPLLRPHMISKVRMGTTRQKTS